MNNIELSIQVNLDGFSFLAKNALGDVASGSFTTYDFSIAERFSIEVTRVKIYCSVSVAQVIPAEVFDSGMAYHYLSATNMLRTGQVALWAPSGNATYVVWALDSALYDTLSALYPSAEWLHPLVEICGQGNLSVMNLILDNRVAHITLFAQSDLVAAVSVNYTSQDDILYYARRISKGHAVRVVVAGVVDGSIIEKLEQHYTSVDVYADPLFLNRL